MAIFYLMWPLRSEGFTGFALQIYRLNFEVVYTLYRQYLILMTYNGPEVRYGPGKQNVRVLVVHKGL